LKFYGILNFLFDDNPKWNNKCHVFLYENEFQGSLRETEEMKPKWFDVNNIPYEKMWKDDEYWLPRVVLKNERVHYLVRFNKDEMTEMKELDLNELPDDVI